MTNNSFSTFRSILILVLLVIFCPLAIDIYLPAFVEIATSLSVSNSDVQLTISLFMVSVGIAQLILGPLSDKYGRKPIALFGIITYTITSFFAYLATNFDMLIFARILQGIGASATFVSCFAIVRDSFNANKSAQMITYLNGIVCFIPALAPILGSWLTIQFGWRMNFLFLTGFGLISLVIFLSTFKETKPQDSYYQGNILDLRRFMPMLGHSGFMFNACICLLAMSAILAFVTSAPAWLMKEQGLTMESFTHWFSINALISICASFIAPIFIKRSTKKALSIGLMLLVLGGGLLIALSSIKQAWAFMLPIFMTSVGLALTLGSAAGKALEPFSKQAGTASALIGLMQMSGAGLFVTITQTFNLNAPMYVAFHMILLLPMLILLLTDNEQTLHYEMS
ncbi:multidrug effflux MFS transporter [Pseudoalteromonas denitrificans]|uniref:Bcr/CflA family efflux transporter n=1 Tax=Pseudoalteromonas denitrificans DSM 6059 TaxID=1123010 RepID=A0A1I1MV78_9GAMM|nr:multidrug effflux MFS transporter [Pseudoalteromonas denitrificans]SFC85460.1 MFS transporter, DHA1 family, bicyclomycin/chloramphenicol resistance protein [Pseudoalteromonas denitrificans DSM 6059]